MHDNYTWLGTKVRTYEQIKCRLNAKTEMLQKHHHCAIYKREARTHCDYLPRFTAQ